jgi:hypothetical protein
MLFKFPEWKPLHIETVDMPNDWDNWVELHERRHGAMLFYENGYIIPRRVYDRSFRLNTLACSLRAIAEINAQLRAERKLLAEEQRLILTDKFLEFHMVSKASEVESSIWSKLPHDIIETIAMHTFEI